MTHTYATVISETLNIRKGPGTAEPVQGQLAYGDRVHVVETQGEWSRIDLGQAFGYVANAYLEPEGAGHDDLPGFRGNALWIHRWEGHAGKPYWPGGQSGVTLDPGLDLGHADQDLVRRAYQSRLNTEQFGAVQKVLGKQGPAAKEATHDAVLQTIRVDRHTAGQLFPLIAEPYWNALLKRFPRLAEDSTPGTVHTAMLSLAYNRGANNRHLDALREPISNGDWQAVGTCIAEMQQDHQLTGIRKRRRAEGHLILDDAAA